MELTELLLNLNLVGNQTLVVLLLIQGGLYVRLTYLFESSLSERKSG